MTPRHQRTDGPGLPDHVTLPLLDRIMAQAIDGAYSDAAGCPTASPRPSKGRAGIFTIVAIAVFGLLVAMSLLQQERLAPDSESGRNALIDKIQQQRLDLQDQQDRLGGLRGEVGALKARDEVLSADQDSAEVTLRERGGLTGFGAVTGPGIRLTVDDSPSGLESERVVDADLAVLADALWGIGAEAIAINDQRLTVQSAIRNSDWAIHVNGRPLRPPYVVEAIGDPLTMLADLTESSRGQDFLGLVSYLNFEYDQQNVDELTLPAANPKRLTYAVFGSPDPRGDASQEPSEEDPGSSLPSTTDTPGEDDTDSGNGGGSPYTGQEQPGSSGSTGPSQTDDTSSPTDEPTTESTPEESP